MKREKTNRPRLGVAAMVVVAALAGGCAEEAVSVPAAIPEPEKPIIAHLFADAAGYDGRQVTIYGLVIETEKDGRRFTIQDVSQMPLTVVKTQGLPAVVGDQMLIEGVFRANRGDPYLEAGNVTYTKVLGGGGCC